MTRTIWSTSSVPSLISRSNFIVHMLYISVSIAGEALDGRAYRIPYYVTEWTWKDREVSERWGVLPMDCFASPRGVPSHTPTYSFWQHCEYRIRTCKEPRSRFLICNVDGSAIMATRRKAFKI